MAIVVVKKLNTPGFGCYQKNTCTVEQRSRIRNLIGNGLVILNEPLVASLGLSEKDGKNCVAEEKEIIEQRFERFKGKNRSQT